jgi:hypothetical protein
MPTVGLQQPKGAGRRPTERERLRRVMARKRVAERDVERPKSKPNYGRKRKCGQSLGEFLRTYMPATFSSPWSPDHLEMLGVLERALLRGGQFAFAMPRGSGKTSICEGAALWALLNGHRRYLVLIAATAEAAGKSLDSIRGEIETNDRMLRDFWPAVGPLRALEGSAVRARGQTVDGERTHAEYRVGHIVFPAVEGSPSSGSILEARGLTGNLRGLKHKTPEGETIRPDFVLIDDPQTDESARSVSQCDEREELLCGAVLGLAGPRKRIAAVCPCTVIERNDLADRLLDGKRHPDWQGRRCRLVYAWPAAQDTLWREYAELRQEGLRQGDDGEAATAFYAAHREEMDAGAKVGWEHRYHAGELSALQHAENLRIDRGERVFGAEFQNDPIAARPSVYSLTPDVIISRCNGLPRLVVPPSAAWVVAFVDVNVSRGLHWAAVAFGQDLAGWVLDYGRYPSDGSSLCPKDRSGGETEGQAIYRGLSEVAAAILAREFRREDGTPVGVDRLLVDCGFQMDVVFNWMRTQRRPQQIACSRGYGSRTYRPTHAIGRPGDGWHWTDYARKGRVLCQNADPWRMHAQKAFLLAPGAPGSLSLYGDEPAIHRELARHVCAETLADYQTGERNDFYSWYTKPGEANDWLDALVGCCVGASSLGATIVGKGARVELPAGPTVATPAAPVARPVGRSWINGGGGRGNWATRW